MFQTFSKVHGSSGEGCEVWRVSVFEGGVISNTLKTIYKIV